jgi:hypothetical protein
MPLQFGNRGGPSVRLVHHGCALEWTMRDFARAEGMLMSPEEFLVYPMDDEEQGELVRGELRVTPAPGAPHGMVGTNLTVLLSLHVRELNHRAMHRRAGCVKGTRWTAVRCCPASAAALRNSSWAWRGSHQSCPPDPASFLGRPPFAPLIFVARDLALLRTWPGCLRLPTAGSSHEDPASPCPPRPSD